MESFSADWLALREPADTAARSESLTRLAGLRLSLRGQVRAIDLACGTGANVRYLAGRLPVSAAWTLVDHDQALLDEARRRLRQGPLGDDYTLTARRLDLAQLEAATVAGHDLVTASALLDLVSAAWIQALAAGLPRGRGGGAAGAHRRRARRLYAAAPRRRAGARPGAAPSAPRQGLRSGPRPRRRVGGRSLLRHRGFAVRTAHSDWMLESPRLQRELIDGWARAATEIDPSQATRIATWEQRRLTHVLEGRSRLRVGHRDLVAWR